VRSESEALYRPEPGKSCPTEILEALAAFNAEGRPIWKPMHLQPIYRFHNFVTKTTQSRARMYSTPGEVHTDVGADIFKRGLCLPSDNKLTPEEIAKISDIIHRCFE
jgi:dTDP-4-amino-4,6-dideoxygalactose transaminase